MSLQNYIIKTYKFRDGEPIAEHTIALPYKIINDTIRLYKSYYVYDMATRYNGLTTLDDAKYLSFYSLLDFYLKIDNAMYVSYELVVDK